MNPETKNTSPVPTEQPMPTPVALIKQSRGVLLARYIRTLVLSLAALWAIGVYFWVTVHTPESDLRTLKLAELFALTAVVFLYCSLFISPFYATFPHMPFRTQAVRSRRGLGLAAFFFGLVHAYLSFFKLLGGFAGLGFLSTRYIFAITLSFAALCILTLLAGTSYDYAVKKLGKYWLRIHRFVYLAGILIIIHALLLGTHFSDLSGSIPQTFAAALFVLVLLEAVRFDKTIRLRHPSVIVFGPLFVVIIVITAIASYIVFLPQATTVSLSIHAQHIKLAQDALSQSQQTTATTPGLTGDRTKRYTASFLTPDTVKPNQDTQLSFKIYDANNGNPVTFFQTLYAWPMHLIITDSTLTYFEHIHPTEQADGTFTMMTKFPKAGLYHLYIQYQPYGAIEQQMAFTLLVGMTNTETVTGPAQPVDTVLTKTFENYEVTLDTHGSLTANGMTLGRDQITFTIKDAKTKAPITTVKPFMGAFGHLSMINEKTYDFLHVHPNTLTPPPADANGGPTIDFIPIGIYGPVKPGIYRVFGEFSTQVGTDFDTDFTVEIK